MYFGLSKVHFRNPVLTIVTRLLSDRIVKMEVGGRDIL